MKSLLTKDYDLSFITRLTIFTSCHYCIAIVVTLLFSLLNINNVSAQLPVVRINTGNVLSDKFDACHFNLDDSISLDADIRLRGMSVLSKQKKSFAIKLKYLQGEKCDTSLLGMRKDNYWILDAMAIDVARMRNRVSMDLWNDFSRKSYIAREKQNMQNGTNGRFVELYLNDEYWGIYCLSERLDRKQLQLKKAKDNEVRGVLYKSVVWSTLSSKEPDYYLIDNESDRWNGWEISYPDIKDDEPIDWNPLADIIYWISYSSSQEIGEGLVSKIDVDVWQDYFLLMEFICAEDNICKNQYVYFYDARDEDRMLGVAPWDMDHSWGRDYSGRITEKTKPEFNLSSTSNRIGYFLKYKERLLEKTYAERYAELRQTYFNTDSLKNRFNTYFNLFRETGAAQRETERWNGADGIELNFDEEQRYVNDWIEKRIVFMDRRYHYSAPNSVEEHIATDSQKQYIFNLQGCNMGTRDLNSLHKGIFIQKGKTIRKIRR